MADVEADPGALFNYTDQMLVKNDELRRRLSGSDIQSLLNGLWNKYPEIRSTGFNGLADATSALAVMRESDFNVAMVGKAIQAAGSGSLTDRGLDRALALQWQQLRDEAWKHHENVTDYWLQDQANHSHDVVLRDRMNRDVLQNQLDDLHHQLGQTKDPQEQKDINNKIGELNGIVKALGDDSKPGQAPHFLLQFDTEGPRGHAAIATGDPFNAPNVVTQVFGMTSSVSGMNGDVARSDKLYNPDSTAVITWEGYTAPRNLMEGKSDVLYSAEAQTGGKALAQFQSDILNLHQGPVHMTVIAHSYGGVVAGYAAQQPGGLHAQDVVFLSSIGTSPEGVKAMQNAGVRVWAARQPGDVAEGYDRMGALNDVTRLPEMLTRDWAWFKGDDPTGSGSNPVGTDPLSMPGVQSLDTGPGVGRTAIDRHTGYWDNTHVMDNLRAITTDSGKVTLHSPREDAGPWKNLAEDGVGDILSKIPLPEIHLPTLPTL